MAAQWYVRDEHGQQHGPYGKADVDRLAREGRLRPSRRCCRSAETLSQVLQVGWDQWKWASAVYPELAHPTHAVASKPAPSSEAHPSIQAFEHEFLATDRIRRWEVDAIIACRFGTEVRKLLALAWLFMPPLPVILCYLWLTATSDERPWGYAARLILFVVLTCFAGRAYMRTTLLWVLLTALSLLLFAWWLSR